MKDLKEDPSPSVKISFSQITNNSNIFTCTQDLEKGQIEFDLSCEMKMAGRFYFTITAGENGRFIRKLRIITEPREPFFFRDTPEAPKMLKFSVVNNKLFVEWESKEALTKVRFVQGLKVKEYLLSNHHQRFQVPFSDFKDFEVGQTTVEIQHAVSLRSGNDDRTSKFSTPLSMDFKALKVHEFSKTRSHDGYPLIPDS